MLPSAYKLFSENQFIFQHDNCKVHTAEIVKEFLENKNIEILSWPSQSPDLNPIENAWAEIKRRSKDRNPSNENDLFQLMVNEWNNLGCDYLTSLIKSMPQRCEAVI